MADSLTGKHSGSRGLYVYSVSYTRKGRVIEWDATVRLVIGGVLDKPSGLLVLTDSERPEDAILKRLLPRIAELDAKSG